MTNIPLEKRKANGSIPKFAVEDAEESVELVIPDEKGDIRLQAVLDEDGEIEIQASQTRIEEGENGKEIVATTVEIDNEGNVGVVETKIGEEGITVVSVQETGDEVEIDVLKETITPVNNDSDAFKKQVYEEVINIFYSLIIHKLINK